MVKNPSLYPYGLVCDCRAVLKAQWVAAVTSRSLKALFDTVKIYLDIGDSFTEVQHHLCERGNVREA